MLGFSERAAVKKWLWIAIAFALGLTLALLLGRWLALAQQPLTRHAVGQTLLRDGRADVAAYVFEQPAWQGVAMYRAGRYGRAATEFVAGDSIINWYNAANAFARLGRYDDAIGALETVLARAPDHADARHNLAVIRAAAERARELQQEGDGTRRREHQGRDPDSTADHPADDTGDTSSQDITQTVKDEPKPTSLADAGEQQQDSGGNNSDAKSGDAGGGKTELELAEAMALAIASSTEDDQQQPPAPLSEQTPMGRNLAATREEAMADEILLRRIEDDPALVLRARLNMALRARQAKTR